MNHKYLYDREKFGKGKWQDEPDYVSWVDDATDYALVLRRNLLGCWCGFVGLPPDHKLYQSDIGCDEFKFIEVHGDIQYAHFSEEDDLEFSPPIKRFWIGFNCMGDKDLVPGQAILGVRRKKPSGVYRDQKFVSKQVVALAEQIKYLYSEVP